MIQRANGISIYYEKEGSGKPMILLHGNGEDHTTFSEATAILKDRFTIYALDTRGHGRSSGSRDMHYSTFAEDVKAFIDALSIEKPTVLGFSDGAITALMLASSYPDSVSAVISAGANTRPEGLTDEMLKDIRREYEATGSALLSLMLSEPDISKEDLGRITVPVLVVAGEHDAVKREDTEMIASSIPNSKLCILKGEDHASYIWHSEKIARLVLEELPFLRR